MEKLDFNRLHLIEIAGTAFATTVFEMVKFERGEELAKELAKKMGENKIPIFDGSVGNFYDDHSEELKSKTVDEIVAYFKENFKPEELTDEQLLVLLKGISLIDDDCKKLADKYVKPTIFNEKSVFNPTRENILTIYNGVVNETPLEEVIDALK